MQPEGKITLDSYDEERADILSKKKIAEIPIVGSEIPANVLANITEINSWDDINKRLNVKKIRF